MQGFFGSIGPCLVLLGSLALAQHPATIDELTRQRYGGGLLSIERVLERNSSFTRYLVRYPSDGLQMYGFMNVPNREGRFPVVVVIHGYVNPAAYRTLTYTTRYADALAQAGFITLHPNLRGHGLSQGSPEQSPWRIQYAQEILDLVAIIRAQAGSGPLVKARPSIGLMGHSMGGGIAQRVAVVDPTIRALLLYGTMHGNDLKNAQQICNVFTNGLRGCQEARNPPPNLAQVSPINYYGRLRARCRYTTAPRIPRPPMPGPGKFARLCKKTGLSTSVSVIPGPATPSVGRITAA